MKSTPFPQETESPKLPGSFRFEFAGMVLNLALGLFATSKKLGRSRLLEWFAVILLRCAGRSLEHAAADAYLEFRADLPVQI